jgi:hypothetical protein
MAKTAVYGSIATFGKSIVQASKKIDKHLSI